jgi:hypothetical protein
VLNKDDAVKIATKLKAHMHSGAKHEIAVIAYEGKMIGQFGIRRGSRKDQGHDFIPGRIHLGMRDTQSLAECTFSYDDWIRHMKEKGLISAAP